MPTKGPPSISVSIVLFNTPMDELTKVLECIYPCKCVNQIFLIDNSPNFNKQIEELPKTKYIHNTHNFGFAKGHNVVLDSIESDFHLVLNSDVTFDSDILEKLIQVFDTKPDVVLTSPKILFNTGAIQYSARKFPSILELICRFFKIGKKITNRGEYRNQNFNVPFYPEAIHGCFHLYRSNFFTSVKGFDERYFLYMEDIDMCKQIQSNHKRIYLNTNMVAYHSLKKESSKKLQLFLIHISSMIKYYQKWGF